MNNFRVITLVGLLLVTTSYAENLQSEEIYNIIQVQAKMTTPKKFSATLDSDLVRAQIRRIPRKSVEFEKIPTAILSFNSGIGFEVRIINVEGYYSEALSIYEETLEKSGLYTTIGKYSNYQKFSKRFSMLLLSSTKDIKIVRIIDSEELSGNYAEFEFNKDWELQKSFYYENKVLEATVSYTYEEQDGFLLIASINIIFEKSHEHDTTLFLKDFKIIK